MEIKPPQTPIGVGALGLGAELGNKKRITGVFNLRDSSILQEERSAKSLYLVQPAPLYLPNIRFWEILANTRVVYVWILGNRPRQL